MPQPFKLTSQEEFARLFRVHPSTVSYWVRSGKLETIKFGDTARIVIRDPRMLERMAQMGLDQEAGAE